MGTNASATTVFQMVREGRIGISPLKKGPMGDFSKKIWSQIETAHVTFLKLEQANSKKQSTLMDLGRRVNAMVNASGMCPRKTRNELVKKLKSNTAHHFEVNSQNFQEARRLQWTTHANLKAWFEQFKSTLIDLGFAREKTADDVEAEGVVVFFPNQKRRVLNLDETDGTLDNTSGKRGGRKPMVFYAPDVGGGGTQANKSSYSPTIICGSNAKGEASVAGSFSVEDIC